jgi:preprotein translocase subunit SecG
MFTFLTVLIIAVCLFIILIVLIQNPKGGGLTGGLGSAASNVIGVQSAGDVMEKTTWGSAILLLVLCVLTAFVVPKTGSEQKVKTLTEEAAKMNAPTVAPVAPEGPMQQDQPAANPISEQGK